MVGGERMVEVPSLERTFPRSIVLPLTLLGGLVSLVALIRLAWFDDIK